MSDANQSATGSTAAEPSQSASAALTGPGTEVVRFYRSVPAPFRWPIEGILWLAVVAAFLIACMWGVLEVHSSNDTYIGLEAGRKIMSSETFPTTDWFSYTFEGKKWSNQNWLSHVYLWLLYDGIGPNWTIYGTWAMGWLIFLFVAGVVYLRTHSLLAALVTGALVGFGCRDWLSARPATFQFTLMAGTWFALWALMSQGRTKRRWWAILLLFTLFIAWPHAHGSFFFGFGLIVMVIGAEVGVQFLNYFFRLKNDNRPRILDPILPAWQIIGVAAVFVLTFLLGFLLSPFGFDNYTHPFTVTESEVFRTVSEWVPPYREASFPPVGRFWLLMRSALIALLLVPVLLLVDLVFGWRQTPQERGEPVWGNSGAPPSPVRLQVIAVDLAALAIGLYMAMFARRFVPILYILAAPGIATWLMFMGSRWSPNLRLMTRIAVMLIMTAFAIRLYGMTDERYQKEVVQTGNRLAYPGLPEATFLEKVTRVDTNPRMVFKWMNENNLTPNVFTEWTLAGTMAFYVPGLQVYIDGRSQQVYDENHYLSYQYYAATTNKNAQQSTDYLLRVGTEAVVLPTNRRRWFALMNGLENHPQWVRVLQTARTSVFAAKGTEFWQQIEARELAGEMWWPDEASALATRGNLRLHTNPPDYNQGMRYLLQGVNANYTVGPWAYPRMVGLLVANNQSAQALQFIASQRERLRMMHAQAPAGGLGRKQLTQLINLLDELEKTARQ